MQTFRLWRILLISTAAVNVVDGENYNTHLIDGITNLFKSLNVQTIGTTTCWDTSINSALLTRLTIKDISITFDRQIMAINHQTPRTWYKSGMLVDLTCDQASSVLQKASRQRLFNLQNVWVLFDRNRDPNSAAAPEVAARTFRTRLNDSYVMPDSRVYLLIEIDADRWEVWDGFRPNIAADIRVSRVGTLTSGQVDNNIQHSDRTNFQRAVLRGSTVILEPNNFLGWDKPIRTYSLDVFAHMHYAMTVLLAEQLNFTLNLTFSSDYGWSYGNGSYSGLSGELQRGEIDFTAAGSLIRVDRMEVGDLTVGTFAAKTRVIFRQPPLSSVNNIFTLPFARSVWVVMVMMISVFAVALIFLTWTSNSLRGKNTPLSIALDTVTMVLGAVCQQGHSIAIRSVSVRLTIFVLFLTAVFLFTSYATSIVVLLQSTSKSIKDVNDLTNKPITFSVQDTKHIYVYFNESIDENIKRIYVDKIKPQGKKAFTSPEIGIERVRNEFHSYLVEITLAYDIISRKWQEHEKCGLSELELFKIPLLTIYMVKNSGFKDVFKQKIIQQYETGLRYRIARNTLPKKQKCGKGTSAVINFNSVSMKEIYPALLFLGYGICLSLTLLLFEHIYKFQTTILKGKNANVHNQ